MTSAPRAFDPILLEYEGGDKRWGGMGRGFARDEDWQGGLKELLHDDDNGGLLIPILAFAHENDPDVELRPDSIGEEKRSLMLASLAVFVPRIYTFFSRTGDVAASASEFCIVLYKILGCLITERFPRLRLE